MFVSKKEHNKVKQALETLIIEHRQLLEEANELAYENTQLKSELKKKEESTYFG